jgi:tetratricopeptide (TPR) repeat protein
MAEMEYAKNRLEQAESFYKQAIELKTKALGQSQQIADLQRNLGLLYLKSTRYTAAESMLLDALGNSQAASGEHSAASVQLLKDLSKLYLDMKEFSKAESMVKLADQLAPAR